MRKLWLRELFLSGDGNSACSPGCLCTTHHSRGLAGKNYQKDTGENLREFVSSQLNGRGKVVISVEHLLGSHLSRFDFFRFPKGPNDFAYSELVLCASPNVGTH